MTVPFLHAGCYCSFVGVRSFLFTFWIPETWVCTVVFHSLCCTWNQWIIFPFCCTDVPANTVFHCIHGARIVWITIKAQRSESKIGNWHPAGNPLSSKSLLKWAWRFRDFSMQSLCGENLSSLYSQTWTDLTVTDRLSVSYLSSQLATILIVIFWTVVLSFFHDGYVCCMANRQFPILANKWVFSLTLN